MSILIIKSSSPEMGSSFLRRSSRLSLVLEKVPKAEEKIPQMLMQTVLRELTPALLIRQRLIPHGKEIASRCLEIKRERKHI
jgi:hypothetical protein